MRKQKRIILCSLNKLFIEIKIKKSDTKIGRPEWLLCEVHRVLLMYVYVCTIKISN